MIHECYPWKEDLLERKEQIIKYNCYAELMKDEESDEETAYTYIEKGIFYTAFIIRKLIDCKSKLSDEADKYAMKVNVYNAKKTFDMFDRCADEQTHDWKNVTSKTVQGKDICNWLIHSYFFILCHDEKEKIAVSFFVASDFDRNKFLYEVSITDWLKYIDFIASDDIVTLEMKRNDKGEFVYIRKKRWEDKGC